MPTSRSPKRLQKFWGTQHSRPKHPPQLQRTSTNVLVPAPGPHCPGSSEWGGPSPTRRKEIAATNYHSAISTLLAPIWPIFTVIHAVLNGKGLKFTEVSRKGRLEYFLGFGW